MKITKNMISYRSTSTSQLDFEKKLIKKLKEIAKLCTEYTGEDNKHISMCMIKDFDEDSQRNYTYYDITSEETPTGERLVNVACAVYED